MKELKEITEENCREVCLLLWERLSKYNYKLRYGESNSDFKVRHIKTIGYNSSRVGCPLCQGLDFEYCPLADDEMTLCGNACLTDDYSYSSWGYDMFEKRKNDKKLAKAFLNELREVFKNEGK